MPRMDRLRSKMSHLFPNLHVVLAQSKAFRVADKVDDAIRRPRTVSNQELSRRGSKSPAPNLSLGTV